MLKKRIVGVVLVRHGIAVQSVGFRKYLPIGDPVIAVDFLSRWGIDEIVLLDITATKTGKSPDLNLVRQLAKISRVPLTVGGGINNLQVAIDTIRSGADKLSFNHVSRVNPKVIESSADVLGKQCVIASIDIIKSEEGYRVFDYLGMKNQSICPFNYASNLIDLGAGEIFVNFVDHDGSGSGFDCTYIKEFKKDLTVPMIACGGAGKPSHFVSVFQDTDVEAAAAANFFNFTEHAVTLVKAELFRSGIPTRHDTPAKYLNTNLDSRGRLRRKTDHALEDLLFMRTKKEVI